MGPLFFFIDLYSFTHSLFPLLHVSTLPSLSSLLSLIAFLCLPLWPNLDWSKYLCLKPCQPWISLCRSPQLVLHAMHHLNLLSVVLHEGVRFGMGFEIWKCGGLWGSVWIGGSDVLWLWWGFLVVIVIIWWLWWCDFFFFFVVSFCCDYEFFWLVVDLQLWWWWGFRSSVGGLWVVV